MYNFHHFHCQTDSLLARLELLEYKIKDQEATMTKQESVIARLILNESKMKVDIENEKQRNAQMESGLAELSNQMTQLISSGRPVMSDKNIEDRSNNAGRALVPQDCRDLAFIGHYLNGFYQVVSPSNPDKLSAVYCNFRSEGIKEPFKN